MKKTFISLAAGMLAFGAFAWGVTLTQQTALPEGAGVLSQNNLTQVLANIATANTNTTNLGVVLGAAAGAPAGTGSVCLTAGCASSLSGPAVFLDTGTINLTLAQLQTLNSVGYTILAAPGATSMYQMGGCTLNLTYGSAAFSSGGTVSIGYGTASSPATNGTIAATVFTTFSSSHAVVLLPVAVAVTATTSLANKAIVMTAASADFAGGTAATGQLDCQYRILTGVS